MHSVTISIARTSADIDEAARLLRAYAASLPVSLAYQDFESEVALLPGAYAPPRGALLLARGGDGEAIGCVAVRPLADVGECEIKRLYAEPHHRGRGVGRDLASAALASARGIGYRIARLDTLPSMAGAQRLYASLGFSPTPAYYSPTPDGTVFMALEIGDPAPRRPASREGERASEPPLPARAGPPR